MKIKEGEFIRTNRGNIGKLDEIRLGFNKDTQKYQDIFELDNGLWTISDYIVNHSFNIIDLIEPGDILKYKIKDFNFNSKGIVYIEYDLKKGEYYKIVNGHRLEEIQIIGILTHEQYERNCYRLEDD